MSTEENTVIDPTLTVTTDQADYAPDSTATITAENVTVGGTVEFVVTDLDTTNGTVSGTNETWTVTDGGAGDLNGVTDGTIVTTWQVNQDAAGEAFVVTATDTTTSDTATAAFTDTPPPPGPTVTASDFTITVNPDGTITASVYLDVENGTIDTDHSGGPPNGATEVHLLNSCTDTTQPGGGGSYFLTQVDGTAGGDGHYAITFTPDFAGTDHVDSEDDCCDITYTFENVQVKFDGVNGTDTSTPPGVDPFVTVHDPNCDGPGGTAALSLSKDTVCPDDTGHSINGGIILAGEEVTWIYTLTNPEEDTGVSNIVLTDDQIGTIYDSGVLANTAGFTFALDKTGGNQDDILEFGETWTFTVTGTAIAGAYSNIANATGDDVVSNDPVVEADSESNSYFGADPSITLTKLTNGSDGPDLLVGQAITWTYDVHNGGNVDLTTVSVIDDPSQTITAVVNTSGPFIGANTGDLDGDGVLDQGETWHFQATGTATAGAYSNIATATANTYYNGEELTVDDCDNSLVATAEDDSSYTGHARAQEGLTKGYWATHATRWDVVTTDDSGGADLNPCPQYNWNGLNGITKSAVVMGGPASGRGLVNGANNGGGDSGLLLGDLNHDGLVTGDGSACHLFFDLASAQALANSPVSGDARIILAGQAVAAQLNEYQGYVLYGHDTSPNGLISEAAQWLKGQGPLSFDGNDLDSIGDSNVNTITANDVGGVTTVINDGTPATNDYTLSGGAITLKGTALSSSSASWQTKAVVFSEATSLIDFNKDGDFIDYASANGEGLKNALAAYNHGGSTSAGFESATAGFVTSQDGSVIGWEDSIGGTPYDVHDNAPDVFWAILGIHEITGVEWHDQTAP